ncbi:hypothetical protein BDB01DRAFT_584559 [Pilobolus umbonatus]|nr:hypothetical protein BDB01DRAFT_584559 [Pilobolus umbonatus]
MRQMSADNDQFTENDTALYFRRATVSQLQSNSTKTTTMHIVDASQTILFTASSLKRTISRCINCIGNDSIHTAFAPTLHKLKISSGKLMAILDTIERKASADTLQELIQTASLCISVLKELCWISRTRLSVIVQGLDAKFSRNLLMNLYSATVDMKAAWETISPFLDVPPITTLTAFVQSNHTSNNTNNHHHNNSNSNNNHNQHHTINNSKIISTHSTPTSRDRSLSELTANSLMSSPLSSPGINSDNNQLFSHLKNALNGSLHVLNLIRQSIEDILNADKNTSDSLNRKLLELLKNTQTATDFSNRLDKNLDLHIHGNKEDAQPARRESSRKIWEDTSIYLKAIVGVMSSIRSVSTEEDFRWPRPVKQGCLYVTRMTTEVAKTWNNYSTFAEDGFYLGRPERGSMNDQSPTGTICSSPIHDTPINQRKNSYNT